MLSMMAPTGFSDLQVLIDGLVVDPDFDAGETFTFAAGVSTFKITGFSIDTATTSLSSAFPLFMDFTPGVTRMVWTADISPIPEPSSYLMMLGGLAALGAVARRRKA